MNIALFDLDQTLADYDAAMRRDLQAIAKPDDPPLPDNLHDKHRLYLAARIRMIRKQPDWWLNLKPLKIGFKILEIAQQIGFSINILTKGPRTTQEAWTQKVLWVQRHVPDAEVTITENKSLVYGKVLVDDYAPYVISWLKHRPRGLVIIPITGQLEIEHSQVFNYTGMADTIELRQRLQECYDRKT